MINLFLQIIIGGISVAAICNVIVYYDGPFHMFPRLRESLLPKSGIKPTIFHITDLEELRSSFTQILMDNQAYEGDQQLWQTYQTLYNPLFYHSFRATLYEISTCPFCLGPYVSVMMSLLMTIYMMLIEPIGWHNLTSGLIVALGSYGLHVLIIKGWEAVSSD